MDNVNLLPSRCIVQLVLILESFPIFQDNNPFSEEFQEREQMEKMRESQGKQIPPPAGPLEKPAGNLLDCF